MGESRPNKHNHNIPYINGDKLQQILCDDVENSWTKNDIYFFNIPGKLRVTIFPNPRNQPGDGYVSFKDIKADQTKGFKWEDLSDVVENSKFRSDYKTFMEQLLGATYDKIGFKSFSANFLLLFEVARRIEPITSGYPTQEEIKMAIRKVCSHDNEKYKEMVGSISY